MEYVYRSWGEIKITLKNKVNIKNMVDIFKEYNINNTEFSKEEIVLDYQVNYGDNDHYEDFESFIKRVLKECGEGTKINGKVTLDYAYPDEESEDYDIDEGDFVVWEIKNNEINEIVED